MRIGFHFRYFSIKSSDEKREVKDKIRTVLTTDYYRSWFGPPMTNTCPAFVQNVRPNITCPARQERREVEKCKTERGKKGRDCIK